MAYAPPQTKTFDLALDADRSAALTAALTGDHDAFTQLVEYFSPRLKAWAIKGAPDLAVFDRFDDAVNGTWELLARRSPISFDATKVRATSYLAKLLRNAIRDVRAQHVPPGETTRRPPNEDPGFIWPRWTLTLDDIIGVEEEAILLIDVMEDIEDKVSATQLLQLADATASPLVVDVMHEIYEGELTLDAAAARCGRHRTSARRAIDRWVDQVPVGL